MCPVCVAAAALIAVKASSTLGLAALAINKVSAKNFAHEFPTQIENPTRAQSKEDQNVQHDDCN
jgi:hypothetical protein